MRRTLLVSTAALVASIAMASAQNAPGGAQPQSGAAAQHRQQGGQAQQRAQDHKQSQNEHARSERGQAQAQHEQTTGQAQKGEHNMQGQDHNKGQAQRSEKSRQHEQTTGRASQGKHNHAQGEAAKSQAQQSKAQPNERNQTTGQAPQNGRATSQNGQAQQGQQGKAQQSQAQTRQNQRNQTTGQAPNSQQGSSQQAQGVNLTTEQRNKIQQTVLARSNVPRVNNVNFALSVGTVVPARVSFAEVPPALIQIYPQWRGHRYFVANDEIVIVDHARKVVATVPLGGSASRGARLGHGGAAMNWSKDQIEQVQRVLIRDGFSVGEVDGILGPRTRHALIAFQRRHGFEASGQIDNRTVSALGLSNLSRQGGGQSTTGQGGQGKAMQGNQSGNQPSTTGQKSQKMNPPSGKQGAATQSQGNGAAKQPSTTGQGGEKGNQKMQQSPENKAGASGKNETNGRAEPMQQKKNENSSK